MLMDGRLVALSEEERRLMRASATASKRNSEELPRSSLGWGASDSQPGTPVRAFPSVSAWSGSEKGASLGSPAHDDPPTQRSRSRCGSVVQACIYDATSVCPMSNSSRLAWAGLLCERLDGFGVTTEWDTVN